MNKNKKNIHIRLRHLQNVLFSMSEQFYLVNMKICDIDLMNLVFTLLCLRVILTIEKNLIGLRFIAELTYKLPIMK
jgi:hypothetical protein